MFDLPYRVKLYTWSDTGSDGRLNETYTFREEVWADFEPATASERTQGEAETHDARGRFTFHERTTVNVTDLMVINGKGYRVIGNPQALSFARGMLRVVEGVWVDTASLATVG